jgi:ribonuclease BN (tRNA processing enzyme)
MPLWDKSRGPDYDVHHFHVDHNCFNHPWQEGLARFPAFGYAVKTLDGKTTIVFSGDTAFPLPMDIIAGADIVIHDVQFYNDGTKGDHVHCPYRLLRDAVPPEHRHKVWLTHTGHELPPEALADGFTKLFRNGTMIVL